MDHEIGPWKMVFPMANLMIQHPWSNFLKNQFTKPLDSSMDVNQMWIKRNDHAPKIYVFIFRYMLKKGSFESKQEKENKV